MRSSRAGSVSHPSDWGSLRDVSWSPLEVGRPHRVGSVSYIRSGVSYRVSFTCLPKSSTKLLLIVSQKSASNCVPRLLSGAHMVLHLRILPSHGPSRADD